MRMEKTISAAASEDELNRLLVELEGDPQPLDVLLAQAQKDLANAIEAGDESQARILAKTQRWLRVLEEQESDVKAVLTTLWEACRTSITIARDEAIEKLRWVVAGLENHIEAERPLDGGTEAHFHILWLHEDYPGFWKTGDGTSTGHFSLRALIAEVAESDSGFSSIESTQIAISILGLLKSNRLILPNLLPESSQPNETIFRLRERGEASKQQEIAERIAFAENPSDDTLIEAHIEKFAPELLGALDEAICEGEAIAHGRVVPFHGRRIVSAPSKDLRARIVTIAKVRKASPKRIAGCINALAVQKLRNCHLSGDVLGAVKYGDTLRDLAPLMLDD